MSLTLLEQAALSRLRLNFGWWRRRWARALKLDDWPICLEPRHIDALRELGARVGARRILAGKRF